MLRDKKWYLKKIYQHLKENETLIQGYNLICINSGDCCRHISVSWADRYAYVICDAARKEFRGGRASKYALKLAFEILEK